MSETAETAIRRAARILDAAGVEAPRREAKLLLQHAAGLTAEALLRDRQQALPPCALAALDKALARRAAREPLSHITGRRAFWSLSFRTTVDVLDPRPDSEALIEAVVACYPQRARPLRILDLGTGSGCLLLTLLHEFANATGLGVDCSEAALAVAAGNARELQLAARCRFVAGNWADAIDGSFDLVIANPPYVRRDERAGLQAEVRLHEPWLALDGGDDGLDAYRQIAASLPRLLRSGGRTVLECGRGQADAVAGILRDKSMIVLTRRRDLAGIERCVVAGTGK